MKYISHLFQCMVATAMLSGGFLSLSAQDHTTPSVIEENTIPGYNRGLVPGEKVPDSYLDMDMPLMDPLPDGRTSVKLRDFRGKLLILDFWSIGCPSCIKAFPKVEALQNEFGDSITVLVVNRESKERILKGDRAYKPFRMSVLPALNEVSSQHLTELFPHKTVPHHVWIDAEGKVAAVTNGYNSNAKFIRDFLKGKPLHVNRKTDFDQRETFFEQSRSLLSVVTGSDALDDRAFYSYFSRYTDILGGTSVIVKENMDSTSNTIRNMYLNKSVLQLYRYAFSGRDEFYPQNFGHHYFVDNMIELRVQNPDEFFNPKPYENPEGADEWYRKWCFSYEHVYPAADSASRFPFMQQDLNRYFGSLFGINGHIEKQRMKCLVLVRTSAKDKLTPPPEDNRKPGRIFPRSDSDSRINQFVKTPLRSVVSTLQYANKSFLKDVPTPLQIEVTGIDIVNMNIPVQYPSIAMLRKELKKYDLDIIEAEREIDRLVITEIK